jgi:hypothetical protein
MTGLTRRRFWPVVAAAAAIAAPIAVHGAAAEQERKADPSARRTCEVNRPTGSRLGGVARCRTKAERDEAKADSRNTVDRIQNMRATACGMPGAGC